jgi:glutamine amidotransferase
VSVAVIDIGIGNTASVVWALERLGAQARLTADPQEIFAAERLVFPGVGSAGHAARRLDQLGLRRPIQAFGGPVLGICLGMQLLYEGSDEGEAEGLGLLSGQIVRMPSNDNQPIPHMGWNALKRTRASSLLSDVEDGAYAYFVHSYAAPVSTDTVASVDYAGSWSAVVTRDRIMGCQFHPERSGAVGAKILSNFLAMPC